MKVQISQRKLKRFLLAENVAREARWQCVQHGGIFDNPRLFNHVLKWLSLADKKTKWVRPEPQGD